MKNISSIIVFLFVGLLLAVPFQDPTAAEATTAAKKTNPAGLATEWDNLVSAAQKEGTIVIYSNQPPAVRNTIIPAFKEKYKINVEFSPGRPAELVAKLQQERRAGLNLVDIGLFGGTTFINDLIPTGICQPLEPLLVLPEVKDPRNWSIGRLPFLDKGKTAILMVMMANSFYQRNIDLVKENEISSSQDLLNPKWKEKIVMSDPGISGAANSWFTWMLTEIMGKEKGLQFMKDLVAQKPAVTRDERQLTEGLAKGKFHISIGPSMSVPAEFIQMGAPIAFIDVKEPRSLSPGFGIIGVFKDAPHSQAAKLFLNWILTREGSSIYAPAVKYASLRADVSTKGILPIMVPRPNDVYPEWKYEKYGQIQGEMRKLAAEVFAPLAK